MNTNESTVSTGATYTTQMDAARKGIITPEMKIVAQKEKNDRGRTKSISGLWKGCYSG